MLFHNSWNLQFVCATTYLAHVHKGDLYTRVHVTLALSSPYLGKSDIGASRSFARTPSGSKHQEQCHPAFSTDTKFREQRGL